MRIEVFGYYLYPAFFITIIGVPLILVGLFILIRRLRERRQAYSTSRITAWEKKHIVSLIDADIEKSKDNERYVSTLKELREYIIDCTYWNTDELLDINKDSILILTSILFDEVKAKHADNPDKSVLLLHAIDNINGGIEFEMGKYWMADDMAELNNHEKMGKDEQKVLALCESSLHRINDEYVNLDSNKIPLITEAIEELVGTEREDIGIAIRDVLHCIDFTDMKESTYDMLELALIDMLDKVIESQEDDYYEQYYLSCFRTLACVIDRQLYDDILKTIEK